MNPVMREIQEIEAEQAALARLAELRRWRRTEAPRLWAENAGYGSEISDLLSIAASVFGVPHPRLFARTRMGAVVQPRLLAMQILREEFKLPFATVARIFGRKQHATVVNACHRVKEWTKTDKIFRTRAAKVREMLKERLNEKVKTSSVAEIEVGTKAGGIEQKITKATKKTAKTF